MSHKPDCAIDRIGCCTCDGWGGCMTDRHPKVWTTSVYAATDGKYMGNFVAEGVPLEEGLFVPLGGVHLCRDENGKWPEWALHAMFVGSQAFGKDGIWDSAHGWELMLDALEAAQKEGGV